MMTLTYPAILFDLDGTLCLSLETKINNACQLWNEVYAVPPEMVRAAYISHSGLPRQQLFRLIGQETIGRFISNEEYDNLSIEFTRRNIETLRQQPFVNGCTAFLSELFEAGAKMGISSSADPDEVEARLNGQRESSFFQAIMGSKGLFHKGRPHIEYFATLIEQSVSAILMVGDEPNDLKLAREAGAKVALVAQTRPISELTALQPDICVSTLLELRPYLS